MNRCRDARHETCHIARAGLGFLQALLFGGCAVFIGAANIERLVTTKPAESSKHIGGKYLNEVAEMRNIIHVGKS